MRSQDHVAVIFFKCFEEPPNHFTYCLLGFTFPSVIQRASVLTDEFLFLMIAVLSGVR